MIGGGSPGIGGPSHAPPEIGFTLPPPLGMGDETGGNQENTGGDEETWGHFLAGFIPVYGSARDAYEQFGQGHYVWGIVNVGLTAVDLFTVGAAGVGIKAVAKGGVKGLVLAAKSEALGTIKAIGTKGLQLAKGAADNIGAALWDDAAKGATKVADDLAGKADEIYDTTRNQLSVLDQCFARDTLVATPFGAKQIGEIEPGELVLAHDFQTGEWVTRQVLERHDNLYNGPLVTITTDAGPIQTTLYHPFWVVQGHHLDERSQPKELSEHEDEGLALPGRWVNSHELRAGDALIGRDGRRRIVLRIEQEYRELFHVSNLTIHEDHTFAVGEHAILVHNTAACGLSIPQVTDPKLKNLVDNLYKGARGRNPIGTGSTADAVRNELLTGMPTHGRFHSIKARETVTALTNWLRKHPNASHHDRLVAQSLLDDLISALAGI